MDSLLLYWTTGKLFAASRKRKLMAVTLNSIHLRVGEFNTILEIDSYLYPQQRR